VNGVDQNPLTFSYQPNTQNFRTDVTDQLGRRSTFEYDTVYGTDQITSISGPLCNCGGATTILYQRDPFGRIIKATNANGLDTNYTYGNDVQYQVPNHTIIGTTQAIPQITIVGQISAGSGINRTINLAFDGVGSPHQDIAKQITYPSVVQGATNPVTITYQFNSNGTIASFSKMGYLNPTTTVTYAKSFGYNGFGQLQTIYGPRTNESTTFAYYPSGSDNGTSGQLQTIARTVSVGSTLTWQFASGGTTHNAFDVYGNPGSIEDPNNIVREYGYDANGRKLSATLDGQVGGRTNPLTSFSYDQADNLLGITLPLGNSLRFGYDGATRRVSIARFDSGGAQQELLSLSYDVMGQLTSDQACVTAQSTCPSGSVAQTESFQYTDGRGNLNAIVQ
jgi:YD repeat-containing protein